MVCLLKMVCGLANVQPCSYWQHCARFFFVFFSFVSAGEDFVQIWQTLIFDSSTNTTQCLYIPIINDECVENEPEEFTAALYTEDDCVSFGTNSTTISILDDDCECWFILCCWCIPAKEQQVALCIYWSALNSWMKCLSSLKCHELYVDTWHIQVSKFPLAGVTVDLQETDIMVNEDVGSVQVCVVVKCGCVRRDVEVNLNVLDDTGQCKLK